MELAGNLSVSISLPVSGQLGCRICTTPYCAMVTWFCYGLVTRTFPEYFWLGLQALPRYLPVTFEVVVGWRFGDAHLIAGWGTKCRVSDPDVQSRLLWSFWLPNKARSAKLVTQMRNPAFHNSFDCWGWGTKCRIGDANAQSCLS